LTASSDLEPRFLQLLALELQTLVQSRLMGSRALDLLKQFRVLGLQVMPPDSTLDLRPNNLFGNPARPLVIIPRRSPGGIHSPRQGRLGKILIRDAPRQLHKLDRERPPLPDLRRISTVGLDPFREAIDVALHQGMALGARGGPKGFPHALG